jgi:uncharacterized protein YceK
LPKIRSKKENEMRLLILTLTVTVLAFYLSGCASVAKPKYGERGYLPSHNNAGKLSKCRDGWETGCDEYLSGIRK